MAEDATTGREMDGAVRIDEETARLIDALMAEPPKPLPAIIVFGDDAVFGITPAKRPA
jgi:hypothetical protein